MIAFIIIYCLFLVAYFFTRPGHDIADKTTKKDLWIRAINKYIMATMYLVYAIVTYVVKGYQFVSVDLIFLIALFFAYLGDIFLVFDLNRGGDYFLAGNFIFATYYFTLFVDSGLKFTNFYWILLIWAFMLGSFIFASNKWPKVFKLGKMKMPMTFYLSSIMLHGACGIGSIILLPSVRTLVLGIGSVMFMISDFILTVDKFIIKNNKWIVRANSFFYFIGLLLIALSIAL
ncbi:MAG: hypothetical protein IJB95_01200 [Clostridia bacterium]|nr:hypothetical protein [Clostridia bacterium]